MKEDADLQRWYDNVCRGSKLTASVYLRRLGFLCSTRALRPHDLVSHARSDERWAYNFLMDLVTELENQGKAGSYIQSNMKAVKSWLSHNGVQVVGKIKIRGENDTPTLRNKDALTSSEQALLFSTASSQARSAAVVIIESGLRPESLGNYEGTDGLTLGDMPELVMENDSGEVKVSFRKIPAMIVVRRDLSKTRHQYFTFLPAEGCRFLSEYLEERAKVGEKLDASSPLLTPRMSNRWRSKNRFMRTTLIGRIIKKRLVYCRIDARPYDLRVTFATRLMLAESRGLMIRDYRAFFMGHKGDIEATYTTNKNTLPSDVVEDMRSSFARAQHFLESEGLVSDEKNVRDQARIEILTLAGFSEKEISEQRLLYVDRDEALRKIREKLYSLVAGEGARQKVVPIAELDEYLSRGWRCDHIVGTEKAVVSPPSPTPTHH